MKERFPCIFVLALTLLWSSCSDDRPAKPDGPPLFRVLKKADTGLEFVNALNPTPQFNVFNYMYFFNGAGVAAGDFNRDGLIDLYFTANMQDNKLFLNEGGLKFRDVTEQAGVAGHDGWTTGVSVVDINDDGLLDLYVSHLGDYLHLKGRNQLYVCRGIEDGVPVYEDEATAYGLDLVGFSTQAAFFDYDLDGDLDMYQLNHSLHQNGTFGQKETFKGKQHPTAGDKLMRNDDGRFVEVSTEAGINSMVIGYGLGIATGDINLDGWPDIYIGNDFHENDYLYINQQDGTFREVLTEQILHTSRFSMGVDIADLDNDGWSEIISLDMAPDDPVIRKRSLGEDSYSIFQFKLGYGYNRQYARNNLQLNNGDGTFSEIAMFSGIHATDWSWAPLFLDFDYDGYKDLFISNGIPRRLNDIDYVNFQTSNEDFQRKTQNNRLTEADLAVVEKMPRIRLPNKFFRSRGDLTFQGLKDRIEGSADSFSNGAAYADLDNDGDLDIVVNNIGDEPFVYQNLTMEQAVEPPVYLQVRFEGAPGNSHAIGAKVIVEAGEQQLVYENFPVRGYLSSVPYGLHIGVGDRNSVGEVTVIWPDRRFEIITAPVFNQPLTVAWREDLPFFDFGQLRKIPPGSTVFADVTAQTLLDFRHEENPFTDFDREILIPHKVSTEGPALAVGDADGDGLDDVFIGGAKGQAGALFLQRAGGVFTERTPDALTEDAAGEDVDAVWVDVENDGDLDLIVATGGNEFRGDNQALKQRAYLNDGRGSFQRADLFPEAYMTASCVLAEDFNGDGLVDLFFGGRAVPWNYGKIPESYLFENRGGGVFADVTDQYARELRRAGLVRDGRWSDIDRDGDPDLVLALEWGALTIYLNEGGRRFEKRSVGAWTGWWNFVFPGDFDGDGDVDLLAGNLGKNARFQPTPTEPLRLYVHDFDDNGQIEQILTYHVDGREIPFANYAEMTAQMIALKKKYLYAEDFANASLEELLGREKLAEASVLEANTLESSYFENTGNSLDFVRHPLPGELQWSTQNAGALLTEGRGGGTEIILGGNFYGANIEMGRYDADFGHVLTIGKDGTLQAQPLNGLRVRGQVRQILPITIAGERHFLVARNDDRVQVIRPGERVDRLPRK